MPFKNFASPHCHSSASLDTASTAEAFAEWEAEHGTGTITVTDHGTMAGVRKVYDLATSKKYKGVLTPVLGIEGYLRDDQDPILEKFGVPKSVRYRKEGTSASYKDQEGYEKLEASERSLYSQETGYWEYQKYHHFTCHFLDQAAHDAMVRVLSWTEENRTEKHGLERKPLFTWAQLEELGGYNITWGSGCLIGMVQRHLAFGERRDIAQAYYEKMRGIAKPGNFYVEVFPHVCDRNWDSKVVFTFSDGTTFETKKWKKVLTDRHSGDKGTKAEYFAEQFSRNPMVGEKLLAIKDKREWVPVSEQKIIKRVDLVEEFLLNECTAFSPDRDIQLPCNRAVMELAELYGDKCLISDDSHFATPSEKIVQDVKLMQSGDWRFATSYHRLSSDETWPYFRDRMGMKEVEFERLIDNNGEWADRFKGFKFKDRKSLPTKFYPNTTLEHTFELVQAHGRHEILRKPEYYDRLTSEIDLLYANGTIDLLPYFFVDEEVCSLYTRHGWLTGPGRGSAAGLSLAYYLRITHVDPMRYGLSRDRFMTQDRIQAGKLPDIDQDLPNRDLLVDDKDPNSGWLRWRFGDCAIQISTDMTIKLKRAVQVVARMLSPEKRVPDDILHLAHEFQIPPMGVSDRDFIFGHKDGAGEWIQGSIEFDERLIAYIKRYPKDWEIVQKCLGIQSGKSKHACAFVLADDPINTWIPTTMINGVRTTQPTAAQVESAGGLKMDFLIVNSLKDIGACIRLIQQRSGDTSQPWEEAYRGQELRYRRTTEGEWVIPDLPPAAISAPVGGLQVPLIQIVPHQGKYLDIWDLPEDQAVFREICEGETDSVFQFGTPGAKKWLRHFDHLRPGNWTKGEEHKAIDSIETLAAFTALDRPGPLDAYVTDPDTKKDHNMLVEFARRASGKKGVGNFPVLDRLFPETYGILVFQEQLQKAFQEVGGTTGIEANNFRIHVSKKEMKKVYEDREIFMAGAVKKLGQKDAEVLWQTMETFGQYGFNKSHAICYVIIAYACAWLKHHYPLEWWNSVLKHATKKEIDEKFWPHVGHLIDMPDVALSGDNYRIVGDKIRAPLNLLLGIAQAAPAEIMQHQPVRDVRDLVEKVKARKESGVKSALNTGVMQTLIVGGACEGLFPPGTGMIEQLELFFDAYCQVNGEVYKIKSRKGQNKRRPDPNLVRLNEIERYQARKEVLMAYSTDLVKVLTEPVPKTEVITLLPHGRPIANWEGKEYDVARARDLEWWENSETWPKGARVECVVAAYAVEHEVRKYQGTKEMLKITLDIEGVRRELVKWPDRKTGLLDEKFKRTDYTGSILVLKLSKWCADKPFSIEDVLVVAPPLSAAESTPTPTKEE